MGSEDNHPRILDSSNPGDATCGDPNLGLPNQACPGGGPGISSGGEPGTPGENCAPGVGNVLIVQEPGAPCWDDNSNGGVISLNFPYPGGQYIKDIKVIDIDYASTVLVVTETDAGFVEHTINLPLHGDNSVQTVEINEDHVKWIKLMLSRSGGLYEVTFCARE